MPDLIDVLCAQHQRMFTLLDLLQREVDAFARGEAFDPYVVEGVLDYVTVYPDRLHRPLELLVYAAMQNHLGGDHAMTTQAAEAEHATLSAAARELKNAIVSVGRNASPPRDFVAEKAAKFITGLEHHMRKEEERIFPLARDTLTEHDHADIARAMDSDPAAPALRDEEEAFSALHDILLRQRKLGLTR